MPLFFFDLQDHPQLAAIEILDQALQVAEQALLAAHPELAAGEDPGDGDAAETWIADSLILQVHILSQTVRRYRTAVDERDHPPQQTPTTDPFL